MTDVILEVGKQYRNGFGDTIDIVRCLGPMFYDAHGSHYLSDGRAMSGRRLPPDLNNLVVEIPPTPKSTQEMTASNVNEEESMEWEAYIDPKPGDMWHEFFVPYFTVMECLPDSKYVIRPLLPQFTLQQDQFHFTIRDRKNPDFALPCKIAASEYFCSHGHNNDRSLIQKINDDFKVSFGLCEHNMLTLHSVIYRDEILDRYYVEGWSPYRIVDRSFFSNALFYRNVEPKKFVCRVSRNHPKLGELIDRYRITSRKYPPIADNTANTETVETESIQDRCLVAMKTIQFTGRLNYGDQLVAFGRWYRDNMGSE